MSLYVCTTCVEFFKEKLLWIPKETRLNFIAEKSILAMTVHIYPKSRFFLY